MADWSTIQTQIRDDGGFIAADATLRIPQWGQAAYNDILSRRGWTYLEVTSANVSLVASQEDYVLTGTAPVVPDFNGLIDVICHLTTNAIRYALIKCELQDYDRITGMNRVNSVPMLYTVAGGTPSANSAAVLVGGVQTLKVWPLPLATAGNGQVFQLRYYRNPNSIQLSANGDLPIIPTEHHDAIVMGAIARGWLAKDQPHLARPWQEKFDNKILNMIMEDERNRPIRDALQIKLERIAPQADQRVEMAGNSARVYPERDLVGQRA